MGRVTHEAEIFKAKIPELAGVLVARLVRVRQLVFEWYINC